MGEALGFFKYKAASEPEMPFVCWMCDQCNSQVEADGAMVVWCRDAAGLQMRPYYVHADGCLAIFLTDLPSDRLLKVMGLHEHIHSLLCRVDTHESHRRAIATRERQAAALRMEEAARHAKIRGLLEISKKRNWSEAEKEEFRWLTRRVAVGGAA